MEAKQKLIEHFGSSELEDALQNHILILGSEIGFFEDIPDRIEQYGGRFRVYLLGFSLYERAWTLRGMENLLMDMVLQSSVYCNPV